MKTLTSNFVYYSTSKKTVYLADDVIKFRYANLHNFGNQFSSDFSFFDPIIELHEQQKKLLVRGPLLETLFLERTWIDKILRRQPSEKISLGEAKARDLDLDTVEHVDNDVKITDCCLRRTQNIKTIEIFGNFTIITL